MLTLNICRLSIYLNLESSKKDYFWNYIEDYSICINVKAFFLLSDLYLYFIDVFLLWSQLLVKLPHLMKKEKRYY